MCSSLKNINILVLEILCVYYTKIFIFLRGEHKSISRGEHISSCNTHKKTLSECIY